VKIASVELLPVSIPYRHVELSSRVSRGGVSDVVVRMVADDGRVGWGECCSGADTQSVLAAAQAMAPFLLGRSPQDSQIVRRDIFGKGLWDYRVQTGNFAWAGLDMAMLDLVGQEAGLPLWRMLGGRASASPVSYFYYLARDTSEGLIDRCRDAVQAGYEHFYLKVGLDSAEDERMISSVREAIGPDRKLRIDANEAWSEPQAAKLIRRWDDAFDLDFVEAPVRARPVRQMARLRQRIDVRLCANEGLGSETDVLEMIWTEATDVLCFSSYWVGGLQPFLTLARAAALSGIETCKHSHGEFGIAAAAHQHALLALGDGARGHQHTAAVLADDLLEEDIPIRTQPLWGEIEDPGLGIRVDRSKLDHYHHLFLSEGQFLPWAA
jgi:L-alanine-DL-glutamate epimerase-like enolase superfamily enzyme